MLRKTPTLKNRMRVLAKVLSYRAIFWLSTHLSSVSQHWDGWQVLVLLGSAHCYAYT
jgi:hypothetical protein